MADTNNDNRLILREPLNPILKRQEQLLKIESKILLQSERKRILNFAVENMNFFIGMICCYHPLNIELIEKYKEELNWLLLSYNKSLPWSPELIEKYKDKWNWADLSGNKSLPWTTELIDKYKNKWDWRYFLYRLMFVPTEKTVGNFAVANVLAQRHPQRKFF